MNKVISEFIKADDKKVEAIIKEHPLQIPVPVAAKLLGCQEASVREFLTNGNVGMAWKKPGKQNHGFCIPTAQFMRWYLNIYANI